MPLSKSSKNAIKVPQLQALSLSEQQFRANLPALGQVMSECNEYLGFVYKHKGFSVFEEEEQLAYGVHERDKLYAYVPHKIPEHRPEDLITRVSVAASQGTYTTHERDASKRRAVEQLRNVFAIHSENLIKTLGPEPAIPEDRDILDFMLRGAMKNYDPKKTRSQNVMQFMFDREQQKIIGAATKSKTPAPDVNSDKLSY